MTVEEERQTANEERERQRRRLTGAYHRVFDSADGRAIYEDLINAFGIMHPAFIATNRPGQNIEYNDTYGKIRDGQRSVILHIDARLRAPYEGDANMDAGDVNFSILKE